jgi:predicted enzyme related to lactoylglutathione lyase
MLTTDYVPGAPMWLDLGVHDVPAAGAFYGALFGWDQDSTGPESGGYVILRLGGRSVAALGPLTEEGASPAWTLYFHTADADATTAAIERAGGIKRFGPLDVPDLGRMAGFTDPTGAEFAVWQPEGDRGLELVQAVGALCWTELFTPDRLAATGFYHAALGWDYQDFPTPGGVYSLAYPAGDVDRTHGGLMEVAADAMPARWQPYIGVDDCDASAVKAVELGATVLMQPFDVPDVGRIAMFADPVGARLAIIKALPPTT